MLNAKVCIYSCFFSLKHQYLNCKKHCCSLILSKASSLVRLNMRRSFFLDFINVLSEFALLAIPSRKIEQVKFDTPEVIVNKRYNPCYTAAVTGVFFCCLCGIHMMLFSLNRDELIIPARYRLARQRCRVFEDTKQNQSSALIQDR